MILRGKIPIFENNALLGIAGREKNGKGDKLTGKRRQGRRKKKVLRKYLTFMGKLITGKKGGMWRVTK